MPPATDHPVRLSFFQLGSADVASALSAQGWPAYRADQVLEWVYRHGVVDPGAMSNLTKVQRQVLPEQFIFEAAGVTRHQRSDDGTQKLLLNWPDGRSAETVMIPDGQRRTACVSSQAGCPVGCRFCASGINGLQGNLSAGQITEQVFALNQLLRPEGRQITNVVFMGMGEPMANYGNVLSAVRILHDPKCFGLGARRITISTVGVPARIRQLAEEELPLNLAISLHAPNEKLRRDLIPWANHFGLSDILEAARYYFTKTGREVTMEYILLSGVNDRPQHARELAEVCKTLRANVNLIRYNEVPSLPFVRPEAEDVTRFQEILRAHGVNAHVRKSRGRDIDAACGQLRRRAQEDAVAVTVQGAPAP